MGVLTLRECDIHTETRQRVIGNIKSFIDSYEDLPVTEKFVTAMTLNWGIQHQPECSIATPDL